MRQVLAVFIAASLAVAGFAFVAHAADEPKAAPAEKPKVVEVGDMVPDLVLTGLDGKSVSFAKDINGKHDVVFITFMTTACSACQAEVAEISSIVGKFKERVGLYVVSVDIRGAETVKPYAETYRYNATYLLDPKFTAPRLFGFAYTPSVVLADKTGKVLFKKGGYSSGDEDMLAEKVMAIVKK